MGDTRGNGMSQEEFLDHSHLQLVHIIHTL